MCHKSWSCQVEGLEEQSPNSNLETLNLRVISPEKHHGLQHVNPEIEVIKHIKCQSSLDIEHAKST
jgi:hypothetical protein